MTGGSFGGWTFPVPSQEFEHMPRLEWMGADLELRYEFYSETGELLSSSVAFKDAVAYAFKGYEHCSIDEVNAYDRIVEISDSSWMRSLARLGPEKKHFRMFFDELGCFDIVASSVLPQPNDVEGASGG